MSMWARRFAGVCCAAILGIAPAHARATGHAIRVATTDLPPLTMEATPAAPGALYEMVEELARRTRVQATIEFVPWKRALYLSTSQARTAVFPLTRSSEREHQFRWLAKLYHEHFLFMALRNGNFDVAEPARSKQRRIGVLRGSLTAGWLKQSGYQNIVEASSVDEGMRFLKRGIVDAVFGNRALFRGTMQEGGGRDYRLSDTMRTTTTWLGGSLDFSEADAAHYQKAMKEMVDDGTYGAILKKYDLAPGP
jgi:polar amino acid transport system substrate-binding protein